MADDTTTKPVSTESIVHARLDQIVGSLGEMRGALGTIATSQQDVVLRLDRIETWKSDVENRLSRNSERVGGESKTNLQQDAVLADHTTKLEAIATKLDANTVTTEAIKKALTGFLKEHPSIVASIVTLVTTAVGAATAWIAARGGHP